MTPEHRAAIQYLIKRLDMDGGEWPGIEVFVIKEGRHIWGLLPDDIYATLMILSRAVAEPEDEDEDEEDEEI